MAQQTSLREESGLLVEYAAHILVGADEPLHQYVGVSGGDIGNGTRHTGGVTLDVCNLESRGVDTLFLTDPEHDVAVAIYDGCHYSGCCGVGHGMECMCVLSVCYGQAARPASTGLFDKVCEVCEHGYVCRVISR